MENDMEPTYPAGDMTLDEMIETAKALGISIDVKHRRLAKLNPNSTTYNSEHHQLLNMVNARDAVNESLIAALSMQEAA